MPLLSAVIPVYNEAESLVELHAEIVAMAERERLDLEIVFVDDGSRDGSWECIAALAVQDSRVRGIRLRRNFGKAAALTAGFRAARGQIVLTLDADLQDDPAEVPRFLAHLANGKDMSRDGKLGPLDVVSGWKKKRRDPWHKVWPSRVFNRLASWLSGVKLHDHNCGMKAYRAEVLREIRLYGELHRFVPVLAAAKGFAVGEIDINHRPRRFGYSKYGFKRFLKGFLDLMTVRFLTGYGQRPQHLLGGLGLISFLLGTIALIYLSVTWVINQFEPGAFPPLHKRALPIYGLAAVLLGAQLMSMGLLAELITAYQSREEDSYSIVETTPENPASQEKPT